MADYKILGGTDPTTNVLGRITEGLGFPLRPVDESASGGTVTVQQEALLIAASFADQNPASTGVPIQVTFGPAQPNPVVDLAANGAITFAETDEYDVRVRLQIGRSSNPGVAELYGRALVNAVQVGNLVNARLDNQNVTTPNTFNFILSVNAGDVFTIELLRDTTGSNDGGILTSTSALWGVAPSAVITIARNVAITS